MNTLHGIHPSGYCRSSNIQICSYKFVGLVFASCKTSIRCIGIYKCHGRQEAEKDHHFHVNKDRYKSQALLDEGAIFACMAYVDLNPVRAKITDKLENSQNTSIKMRLEETLSLEGTKPLQTKLLQENIKPVSGELPSRQLSMKLNEYIQLVEWVGQSIIYPDKASIPLHIVSILERLNLQQDNFLKQIENMGQNYYRAIGTIEKIRTKARQMKVRCLRGISAARVLYRCSS